ncbi:transporter substrate-binding domain-containing protein [Paraglaciecola aquimarina]|uniref:Transporter substrate-binding domain-containing protein n=1 Tax=Paraglaciecola algarum TaxID=3050085 RepID=A0ABS9D9T5_9ALTE|nr:transporter substrate-binding domain-containing protein [Paraglaciecola sp. G1-23]MCF2949728.1 transporter substrate-binding domain-containing protein [Paraglaciecola sp. G1-23]
MIRILNKFSVFSTHLGCVAFCVVLLQGKSLASGSIDTAKSVIKLATGAHYSPFIDDKLPDGGWSASIVKRVLDSMKLQADIKVLPWERALKWTKEDQIFGAFPYVYSAHRAEYFLFSEPINYVPVHLYVAENSTIKTLEDVKFKRLCFPYDYSLSPIEQQIVDNFKMTINRVKDGIGCIKHVYKGWSDAGLINGYINPKKISSGDWQGKPITIFPEQLGLVPLYFVVNKVNQESKNWLVKFNDVLLQLVDSGEISTINKRYLQLLQTN